MKQIKEFLKEHDLKAELIKDESFVSESKKLFESQGLEFSKNQLEEILGNVSENLETVKEMSSGELANVVGGMQSENVLFEGEASDKRQSKAAIAVEVTMTIVGTLAGAAVGIPLGFSWHSQNTTSTTRDPEGAELSTTETHTSDKKTSFLPPVILGGVGSVVGYQLGKLIVSKYKL